MMNMRRSWLAAALPGVVLLPACSEEVKDINRVQPGYIEKSALDGEWYYRQTVVDVPPDLQIGFVGLEGKLEKVRFELYQGDILIRRTHEAIEGLDETDTMPGAVFAGDVVGAMKTDRFDIVRDYNGSSGSQSNVLNENTSDRPWWEQKYLRPDWGSLSGWGPVDFSGLFEAFSANSYFVPEYERDNPDHLQVDVEDGVISFVTSYLVSDGGETCFFEFGAFRSTTNTRNPCGSGEIKVRHSFVRINPEDEAQFEPRRHFDREVLRDDDGRVMSYVTVSVPDGQGGAEYIDIECTDETLAQLAPRYTAADCQPVAAPGMNRFGFFRTERFANDRRVASGHDELRNFYANQHKVWEQYYEWDLESDGRTIKRDAAGKPLVKKDSKGQPVRIPVSARKVRPIVYYLNVGFPEDLKQTAAKISQDWDEVFTNALASAKGISADALRAEIASTDPNGENTVYRIKDNDCRKSVIEAYLKRVPQLQDVVDGLTDELGILPGNLARVCAALESESRDRGLERFRWQQIGDAKYSFVYWVNENQPSGPLGFGPSGPDAQTGRILSGNAYVYGAAIDSYARASMDMVRFINGDLADDYSDLYLPITSGKTISDWAELRNKSRADEPVEVTQELRSELKRRFSPYTQANPEHTRFEAGEIDLSRVTKDMADRARVKSPNDPFFAGDERGDVRAVLKQRLLDDPVLRERMVPKATVLLLERVFGWSTADHPGEEMPAEMLEVLVDLTVNPRAISEHMRKRSQFYMERNITMPEFIDDAVYGRALSLKDRDPQEVYRLLREEIFRGVMLHEIGHTVGMTHNFRASADALNYFDDFWDIQERFDTDEERDAELQPEYRYTSIMDYGARFNTDFQGLGKYDQAAIKFAYGGMVERFEDDVPVPGRLDMHLEFDDFSKIPELLGGDPANLTRREDVPADQALEDLRRGIRENGQLYAENPTRTAKDYWIDRSVPYFYCFDYYNGVEPRCRTWDEGPSYEETVKSAIQRFWNFYFFSNFRRGRDESEFINGFFGRIDRLAPYLEYPFPAYSFLQQYTNRDGETLDVAEDLLRAAMMGSDFILQVIGTPTPGPTCRLQLTGGLNPEFKFLPADTFLDFNGFRDCQADNRFYEVPQGVGRNQFLSLSDDYNTKIEFIGTFYEKQQLLISLMLPGFNYSQIPGSFLASLEGPHPVGFGYYDVFSEGMVSLVNSVFNGSFGYLRWASLGENAGFGDAFASRPFHTRIVENEAGERELRYPRFFDFAAVNPKLPPPESAGFGNTSSTEIWTYLPYDLGTNAFFFAAQLASRGVDDRLDFYQYLAIDAVGSSNERVVDPRNANADVVEFENPKTGELFRAFQTEDGRSMSVELLRRAADAAALWVDTKERYDEDDNPSDALIEEFREADEVLEFYVGAIQDFRFLRSLMDVGK